MIITDENDNAPQFTGSKFQATVTEGQPAGTFIYQVEAKDLDLGENSDVLYSILKIKPRSAEQMFSIEERSGAIKTAQMLDREEFERFVQFCNKNIPNFEFSIAPSLIFKIIIFLWK